MTFLEFLEKITRQVAVFTLHIWNWKRNKPTRTEEFLFVVNSGMPTKVVYMGKTLYEGTGIQSFDFGVINDHVAPAAALMADKANFNFSTLNNN